MEYLYDGPDDLFILISCIHSVNKYLLNFLSKREVLL